MKIASWNVNSLNVRLPHVCDWLRLQQPDVLALQETKLEDYRFPDAEFARIGYHSVFAGEKTYNGVAILSRQPLSDVQIGIPGFADPQRRVLAASLGDLRVIDVYVVNGKAVSDPKYDYKLRWLVALREWLRAELQRWPRLVLLGDFNIAPDDRDVHDPAAWRDRILCSRPERAALAELLALGLHDSFRLHHDGPGQFSWWDYRTAAFRRNLGLRIDLVLISEVLRGRCIGAGIDIAPRRLERPSDHAPVWVELAMPD